MTYVQSNALPSQTGQAGKYLQTNGTTASWQSVSATGDVVGPPSSVAGTMATFSDGTGKLLASNSTIQVGPNGQLTGAAGDGITLNGLANDDITLNVSGTGSIVLNGDVSANIINGSGFILNANGALDISATTISLTAGLTNGQLLIGVTGGTAALATLTAGPGIGITNAAGSITIGSVSNVNVQSGSTYTIQSSDAGGVIQLAYPSGNITITVPDNLGSIEFEIQALARITGVVNLVAGGTLVFVDTTYTTIYPGQSVRCTTYTYTSAPYCALTIGGGIPNLPQSANKILAGPTTGAAALPTFRSLVAADMPFSLIANNNFYVGHPSEPSGSASFDNGGNVVFGIGNVTALTQGNNNIGIGFECGPAFTIASNNSFIGYQVFGNAASNINDNVGIGWKALYNQTSNNSVAVGSHAALTQASYINSLYLGYGADATASGLTNAGAIGYQAAISISNAYNIGNGANLGVNQPSPANSLHVSQGSTSNVNAIQVDYSTNAAATPTGGFTIYGDSASDAVFVKTADGNPYQINPNLPTVMRLHGVQGVTVFPASILPGSSDFQFLLIDVIIHVKTGLTGTFTNLLVQNSAMTPDTYFSVPFATVNVPGVYRLTVVATQPNATNWGNFSSNSTFVLAPDTGSVTGGEVDVFTEYVADFA